MLAALFILALLSQPGSGTGAARPATPGLGDNGPLARDLGRDARTPDKNGFSGLYELPRRRGQPRRFARIDGALIAVFPYSTYEETSGGTFATVPPGTVYYVGSGWISQLMTPTHNDADAGVLAAPTTIDLSVSGTHDTTVDQTAGGPTATLAPPSIWTDETYRRARLNRLLASP